MSGLWRNRPETPEGKYLVQRRDGSIPPWPYFVLGACDPAAPAALRIYAAMAFEIGMDEKYVTDILDMASEWEIFRKSHPELSGDPDAHPDPDLVDDPDIIEKMKIAKSA